MAERRTRNAKAACSIHASGTFLKYDLLSLSFFCSPEVPRFDTLQGRDARRKDIGRRPGSLQSNASKRRARVLCRPRGILTRITQSARSDVDGRHMIAARVLAPQYEAQHGGIKGSLPGQVLSQAQAKARGRKESNVVRALDKLKLAKQ